VIGLTYKHLALGVLRDAMLICRMMNIPWSEYYKSTEHVLKFPDGGQINFLSIDKIDTAHGIRSGDLYINECNYQSWEIVDQLISRTAGLVFLDCNPSKKFWIVDKILENPAYEGVVYEDVSTYKDNPALAPATIHAIESHDRNSNWWRVYGLGEWGAHEGLVFHNVKIGEMPTEFKDKYRQRFGIDWGFAADAFAFVSGYVVEKDLYLTDEIYMHHALNKDTAPLVKEIAGHKKIICDSARPEAVAEFNSVYGLNCVSAKKPKGSVEGGYQTLQSFNNIYIDPKCRNIYREFTSLEYHKDKNTGDFTGEIEKGQDDHCIYENERVVTDKGRIKIKNIKAGDMVLTRAGYQRVKRAWQTGTNVIGKKIYLSNGKTLKATGNHKVLTLRGFCDIDTLRYDDKVLICKRQKQLSTMGCVGGDTLTRMSEAIGCIINRATVTFIDIFGKNTLERFPKDTISTTKTKTQKTMQSKTLNASQLKSICRDICRKSVESGQGAISKKQSTLRCIGTNRPKVENGTRNTQKTKTSAIKHLANEIVKFVKKSILLIQKNKNSVPMHAKAHTDADKDLITLLKIANGVALSSHQINMLKNDFVVARVVCMHDIKLKRVFDLKVENCPEFFANEILVHNCIDAVRYMIEDITLTKKSIRGMFLNMPAIDIKETIDRESLSMQPDLSLKDFLL
jgi:PBSX family phage terminase large subunit